MEHDFASGTDDPAGTGSYHTFDQLFPTNHSHYGTMDYVGWRNMNAWRLGLRGKLSRRWTLALDTVYFRLANARDFWYAANGAPIRNAAGNARRDPTASAGRDLGSEIDLTATGALGRNVTLSGGISRFWPGDFVRRTSADGRAEVSDWVYLQTGYSF